MYPAFTAGAVAPVASRGALNHSPPRILPGSAQATLASALPGFCCSLFVLALPDFRDAKAVWFHQHDRACPLRSQRGGLARFFSWRAESQPNPTVHKQIILPCRRFFVSRFLPLFHPISLSRKRFGFTGMTGRAPCVRSSFASCFLGHAKSHPSPNFARQPTSKSYFRVAFLLLALPDSPAAKAIYFSATPQPTQKRPPVRRPFSLSKQNQIIIKTKSDAAQRFHDATSDRRSFSRALQNLPLSLMIARSGASFEFPHGLSALR